MSTVIDDSVRRRIVGGLFTSQSLFSGAVIVSFTLTAIIAADLSGSDSAAGLPSTMTLVGRAILAYPAGWMLDRIGRRLGLSFGYLVGILGLFVSAYSIVAGSFIGFLIGAVLVGGSRATAEQSRYVAAEIYPAARQSRIIGLIVFAGTIGAIGGPLLVEPAGNMAESYGLNAYAGPFLLASLFLALAAVVVFVLLRPDPLRIGRQVAAAEQQDKVDASGSPGIADTERSLRQIFAKPSALLAVASMTIGQLVMAMLMVITALHMDHNGHGTQAISLVIMAHTLGMFGLSSVTGWLVDRVGRLRMIAAGSLVLVSACILTPVSTAVPMLALALFLLGLGWNFCFVAGSSLLSAQLAANERGRAQGAGEMAVAIGAAAGSLGSGIIFARGDIMAVSVIGLAFSVALLGMVAWLAFMRRPVDTLIPEQE